MYLISVQVKGGEKGHTDTGQEDSVFPFLILFLYLP